VALLIVGSSLNDIRKPMQSSSGTHKNILSSAEFVNPAGDM